MDSTFDPGAGPNGAVYSVAAQPDGKVLLGGAFTAVNGANRSRIARLNQDGSLDRSFDPGTGANSDVRALALQPDGKVLLGGSFTNLNGARRIGMARLNADGSLDDTFEPGAGARAIALQGDGKIVVAGSLSVARLNPDGTLDDSFAIAQMASGMFVSGIYSVALQSDGKVLVVGDFWSVNGASRTHVARLNADGTLDSAFDPGEGPNGDVFAVAVQANGRVLIGGNFTHVSGWIRERVAGLLGDGAVLVFGPVTDNGDLVAHFKGTPGLTYTIEYQESLSSPVWHKLSNLAASANAGILGAGVFELRDPMPPAGQRFYRAVYPPY